MQYSLDNATWSTTIPQGKNAGTYTVYAKIVGDASHSDSDVKQITVTIAKIKVAIPARDDTVFVATGEDLTYDVTASEYYTVTGATSATAGHHDVTITLNPNACWTDNTTQVLKYSFDIFSKFEIKKNGTITTDITPTYDYSATALPNQFAADNEVLDVFKFEVNAADDDDSSATDTTTTDTYTITMTKKESWGNNFALKYIVNGKTENVGYTTNGNQITFNLSSTEGKLAVVKAGQVIDEGQPVTKEEKQVHIWIWIVCFSVIAVGMLLAVFLYRRNQDKLNK